MAWIIISDISGREYRRFATHPDDSSAGITSFRTGQ
jgi:hypothetical protein